MKTLFVLYDANCIFCRRCRAWLEQQPSYFEMRFVPAGSAEASCLVFNNDQLKPEKELIVVSDEGSVYQGPNAFIMCLYALFEFREWSIRLARPALLPFARQTFEFISNHRVAFSKWLHRSRDDEVAAMLLKYFQSGFGTETFSSLLAAKQRAFIQ